MHPSNPHRSPPGWTLGRMPARLVERCTLARLADTLERVLPDMAQLGVAMLVVAACAAFGGIDLRLDDDAARLLQPAQPAAVADICGCAAY